MSGRRGRGASLLGVTVLLLLATPAWAGDAPTVKKPKKPPRTFESALAARTTEDGTVPVKVALGAFETAFGPVEGVDAKRLPGKGLVEGGAVAELVLFDVWDQLTPAQQDAVVQRLRAKDPRPIDAAAAPAGGAAVGRGPEASIARRLLELQREIGGRLGRSMRIPIEWEIAEIEGTALAHAGGYGLDSLEPLTRDSATAPGRCIITITPGVVGEDASYVTSLLAHEVFHCFQFDFGGRALVETFSVPGWVREGQAAWVGEDIAGGSRVSRFWWPSWLLDSDVGLFHREYSAIGFYADLDANGVDPWSIFDAQLATSEPVAAYRATGADTDFLFAIAKALVREPPLGDAWEQTGPGLTGDRGAIRVRVTPESTSEAGTRDSGRCGLGCAGRPAIEQRIGLDAYGTQPLVLTLGGDVVQLVTTAEIAVLGFRDGTEVELAPGVPQGFCLLEGGCTCEDGTAPFGGEDLPVQQPGEAGLGLGSTHTRFFSAAFVSVSLEDACAAGRGGIDRCLLGPWVLDVGRLQSTLEERFSENEAVATASGSGTLRFRASGRYSSELDLRLTAGREIDGVGPVEAEVLIRGGGESRWTADGFSIRPSEPEATFDVGVSVSVAGRVVANVPVPIPGAGDLGDRLFEAFAYSCPTEDRLVVTPPEGYPLNFTRRE